MKETPISIAKGLGIYYVITYRGRGVAKIGLFSQFTMYNVKYFKTYFKIGKALPQKSSV